MKQRYPHKHFWESLDKGIVAEWEKRPGGETFFAAGDFELCKFCPEGRFVPRKENLRVVGCEKIVKNS